MYNAIHRISHYQAYSVVCFVNTYYHWIAIYPVDSVIQPLNNWASGINGEAAKDSMFAVYSLFFLDLPALDRNAPWASDSDSASDFVATVNQP